MEEAGLRQTGDASDEEESEGTASASCVCSFAGVPLDDADSWLGGVATDCVTP